MLESDLLAELTAELTTPEIEPDEVTTRMLAKSAKIGFSQAKEKLEAMVAQGRLTKRRVRVDGGRIAFAYRQHK